MKTHPHLLVRDALAARFVAASGGDPEARADLAQLARWSEGAGPPPALRAEDGDLLFDAKGEVAERFAALEPYIRDRAPRYQAACDWIASDDSVGNALEQARAAWDAGLFFEVHEIAEPVWLEASGRERELLQGIIMAGAALHHLSDGNLAGARGLLGDAARRLADATGPYDFASFANALHELQAAIAAGQITQIDDVTALPRLERT